MTPTPGAIVQNFYDLALMVGGLLAFGAIVFGAIKYTLAAGNPSGQHEGKEWITQALLGLLLLVGATLVLKVINPDLITLKLPDLDRLTSIPNTNETKDCPLEQCSSMFNKPGITCPGGDATHCLARNEVSKKLECAAAKIPGGIRITEGYPPTVPHLDPGHNNGCAVDLVSNNSSCAGVQATLNALSSCGGAPLNEYAGCGGKITPYRTGDHIHLEGC